ncbi:tubulin binding cofactor C-domain-containing protein [Xylaria bambusicola]|uniref:tubulin binding cofactor C-domain-containing protein n=1 Tax=Xylaria bambusicola TaxID=326684 RepID=UPI0020087FA3|nr:tubulin binding cofactor C-domain-containing protein [Xylaria bambusicola]KAI0506499.1 tubulin binding cofactor C-domain-containing protein [Xylaria bambusicola]
MADPKEKFFRHFQAEITLIQDEIDSLASISPIGGERQTGIDKVLAGISRLSNEVMDATDYIPSYDQRAYSQAIKALTEKLNVTTGKLEPKSRFQFKSRNTGATAARSQAAPDPRMHRPWGSDGSQDVEDTTSKTADAETRDAVGGLPTISSTKNYNEELSRSDNLPGVRKPSFSTAKNIAISDHTGLHIMLPSTASRATSSGSLTNLTRCIVDMTIPTSTGAPFAGLALKNIKHSLIIAGHVAGPTHITGIEDSIIVVAARQVRMHDCKNVQVYLHCTSHPIIEDCSKVAFSPLPSYYANESTAPETNQWDKVDDFKWLKDTASPNWRILPEERRVQGDLWENTVCGKASMSTDDILRELLILTPTGAAFPEKTTA